MLKKLKLIDKYLLSSPQSDKKIYHLTLYNENIAYEPGDIIKIYPKNSFENVEKIGNMLDIKGYKDIDLYSLDLNRANNKFLEYLAKHSEEISKINKKILDRQRYILNNTVIDILEKVENLKNIDLNELLEQIPKIRGRSYSIASSPKSNPNEIHLMIAIESFESNGEPKMGLTSQYIDRLEISQYIEVEHVENINFRLPERYRNILMIGSGTGLAPFLGFLQNIEKHIGKWLIFGERYDIFYKNILEDLVENSGLIFDAALSRVGDNKIYVQNILENRASEIKQFIENGDSHIYVCGSKKMGLDVEKTIITILDKDEKIGKKLLKDMKISGRYKSDIY